MKGDDLLLAHLVLLDEPDDAQAHPSPRERLEAEVGPDLARYLLAALAPSS
jgi:hypothetical protein